MDRREPKPYASFDLDVALALLSQMSKEFGARVVDVDGSPDGMIYVVDVPRWGRALARGTERVAKNQRQIGRNRELVAELRRVAGETAVGVRRTEAELRALRDRLALGETG